MKALGMIEVYSFSAAVCVADVCAKAANVKVIAFDRNRPISPDVPAPLVMVVKIEGDVGAVESAVEAGVSFAKSRGKYIVSHIIANVADGAEKMAYLLDINKDKFNKRLKETMNGEGMVHGVAIGLLEISGLVAAIEALDAMVKAADVHIVHTEKRLGGRLVTLIICGKVDAVSAAIEAGGKQASPLGKVYGSEVIASPSEEVKKFFDFEHITE